MCHILFLHQTTTAINGGYNFELLCHILFLHQTTTGSEVIDIGFSCVISYFYIKPQRNDNNIFNIKQLIYYIIEKYGMMSFYFVAKILKKIQLQRYFSCFFFDLTPKIFDI